MRRVSVANATTGMVLGRSVYDINGQILLSNGDRLTEENLPNLFRSGTGEILVHDPRAEDVPVGALFSAHLEAKAVHGLRILLLNSQGSSEQINPVELFGIRPVLNSMTERLLPAILGDPDLCGVSSLQAYDFIHPVKVAELSMLIGSHLGSTSDN
jgi:hypothetical protein